MNDVTKRQVNINSSNYERNHAFIEKEFKLSYYKDKMHNADYIEDFNNNSFRRFYYNKTRNCFYCVIDKHAYSTGVRLPNINEQINVYDPSSVYFSDDDSSLIKPMSSLIFSRRIVTKDYRIGKYYL
jgi:hypothetical protein